MHSNDSLPLLQHSLRMTIRSLGWSAWWFTGGRWRR